MLLAGRRSLALALGIAALALGLRLSLIGFPTRVHPDEDILAHLGERAVATGTISASLDGFPGEFWSRPSYQFSPHTLVQSVAAIAVQPASRSAHVVCGRVCSSVLGSLAVLLVFFAARELFGDDRLALLGQALLAVAPLQVQDSIYARPDAFLGLGAVATLLLAARALRLDRPALGAALVGGATVAAKYIALPVLLLPLGVELLRATRPRARALAQRLAVGLLVAAAGFLAATPEALAHPGPLLEGLLYELGHYAGSHVPHQAYDAWDNNAFYWLSYLAWLGVGFVPLTCATIFFSDLVRSPGSRTAPALLLGAFLLVGGLFVCATPVRFERNLELVLGALCAAAAAGAWEVVRRVQQLYDGLPRHAVLALLGLLALLQQGRTLVHLRAATRWSASPLARAARVEQLRPNVFREAFVPPTPADRSLRQIFLSDFGDPFSRAGWRRWQAWLGPQAAVETFTSSWAEHDYPFSTIDVYHGPRRLYVVRPGGRAAPGKGGEGKAAELAPDARLE